MSVLLQKRIDSISMHSGRPRTASGVVKTSSTPPRPSTSSGRIIRNFSKKRSSSVLLRPCSLLRSETPRSSTFPQALLDMTNVDFPSVDKAEARLSSPVPLDEVGLPAYSAHEEKDFVWREGTRCMGYSEQAVPYPVSLDSIMLQKYVHSLRTILPTVELTPYCNFSDRHTLELLMQVAPYELTFYNFGSTPPKNVLDLGCGDGAWIRKAAARWTVSSSNRHPDFPRPLP